MSNLIDRLAKIAIFEKREICQREARGLADFRQLYPFLAQTLEGVINLFYLGCDSR
jgi:hypothetical protein